MGSVSFKGLLPYKIWHISWPLVCSSVEFTFWIAQRYYTYIERLPHYVIIGILHTKFPPYRPHVISEIDHGHYAKVDVVDAVIMMWKAFPQVLLIRVALTITMLSPTPFLASLALLSMGGVSDADAHDDPHFPAYGGMISRNLELKADVEVITQATGSQL